VGFGRQELLEPKLTLKMRARGLNVLAPYKAATRESRPWPPWLVGKRRRVETVIRQLVCRYQAKKVWAKDC
jgi:hypothetical protein